MGRKPKEIDIDKVLELRNQCYSLKAIAEELEVHPQTLRFKLKKEGINLNTGYPISKKLQGKVQEVIQMYEDGKNCTEIAEYFGVTKTTISTLLKHNGYDDFYTRARLKYSSVDLSTHPLYSTWIGMHQRCYNSTTVSYKYYGAKGVYVCGRWHQDNPDGLINFIADMAPTYKPGLTIDKDKLAIEGQPKCYSPETCCWLTPAEQSKYKTSKFDALSNDLIKDIKAKYQANRKHGAIKQLAREYNLSYYLTKKICS